MSSNICPSIRRATFSIGPRQKNWESRYGVCFVIHADKVNTIGITAADVVRDGQDNMATFHDQNTAQVNPLAYESYWGIGLVLIPTERVKQQLPVLPLSGSIPADNSPLLCVGFPQNRLDDKQGGPLVRTEPPTEGLTGITAKVKRYIPQGDIMIEPALPFGFAGSPIMQNGNVVGMAKYTHRFGLNGNKEHSTGPSSLNILWAIYNWGQGIAENPDQNIAPSIKEILLRIAKGI